MNSPTKLWLSVFLLNSFAGLVNLLAYLVGSNYVALNLIAAIASLSLAVYSFGRFKHEKKQYDEIFQEKRNIEDIIGGNHRGRIL